jgi:selenide, water dikinase
VLRGLPPVAHPDLVVGTLTGDDAAVWRRPDGTLLVATVDFFTPLVDDAATWGRIGAANSVSDIFAMGATPLFALNVVAWPREKLSLDLLGDALVGAAEVAMRAGYIVVGGHTVDGAEPFFGQVVIGTLANEAAMLTNDAGRPGDDLILTKALGTGLVTTAIKRLPSAACRPRGELFSSYNAAVESMTTLNDVGARIAREHGVRAATDVTGFGLVGHLHKLALASGVTAEIDVAALPLLPGVLDLVAEGYMPGGTGRNAEFVQPFMSGRAWADPTWNAVLADPQTSGGLLLCVPAANSDALLADLRSAGVAATQIGRLRSPAGESETAGSVIAN